MIKLLRQQLVFGLLLIGILLSSLSGFSQAGTGLTMTVQNAIQTSPTTFTYDVMLTNTGSTALGLRGYSLGINHAAGLNSGTGTITHTFVSRDAALSTLPAVSALYTAASNHFRLTTTNATAGNEVALLAGVPMRIATMQVSSTVAFPADFNPNLQMQLVTASGKTQAIVTVIITPPGTSYTINGPLNTSSATNLNILNGVMNTPCFYLNPTGVFTATKTAQTPVVCFGGSTGTAQVTLTSTGSAAPYGTAGNYKIDGGANIAYSSNPFTVSGLSAGTHTISVTTSAACLDTAVVTILGPSSAISTSASVSTCASSYTLPWSTIVTTAGTYTNTYVTASGCDSIRNITVAFNSASVNTPTSATACNTYTWSANSTTYTTSGTYTSSFTNAGGCDSSVTLNLTINNSSTTTSTISSVTPYTWSVNGVTYASSGVYTATYLNASGCVSNATLNLTITGAAFTLTIQEDLPISCNGNNDAAAQATVNGSGTYTYSIDGGAFNNTTGYFNNLTPGVHTICANDGTSTVCDTISFIEPAPLAVNFVIDSTVSCLGNDGQITAVVTGGTNLVQGYLTIWTNSNIPPDTLNNQLTNNFDLTVSGLPVGVYHLYIEDDHGCFMNGSTTLGLTPPVVVSASNTPIACNGGSSVITASASGGTGAKVLTIGGSPIASSYPAGTYVITATDAKGCTGTTQLVISQPNPLGSSSTVSSCNTYVWPVNGLTYTASGTYTNSYATSSGCDSILTLNLTIKNSSNNAATSASACNTYTWSVNGTTYTASGTYTASFLNAAGCDSNKVLNLTINTGTTTTTTATANNTYTWLANGQTYTASGVYTYTALASTGCINTQILNLTINYVTFGLSLVMDQPISCYGNNDGSILATATGVGPFVYILDGGVAVNSTGFFTNLTPGMHTVCALEGLSILCDSMLFVEPAPLAATFTLDSVVSCHGGDGMMSINITGGTNVLQGYLTWWTNAAGDTINDILNDNFALYVDSLNVGVYHVEIEDDHGCFFNATGTMVAAPPIVVNANIPPIVCYGATTTITPIGTGGVPYAPLTYTINGNPVATSYGPGTYTIVATDAKGCTGTTSVTITAPTAPITNAVSQTSCNSYTWVGTGITYTVSGVYTAALLAANGCDSTVTLTLTINHSTVNAPANATACNTYTWLVNGLTYTTSVSYTATFLNAAGCDSNKTLNLTINQSTINAPQTASACSSYTWSVNGSTYTASGSYTATFLNAAGCDSNKTLNLTINTASVNPPSNVTACNSYTWTANGTTYTASGTYTATFLNAAGCDSSRTLNLTINNSSVNTPTTATACTSYTWSVNGTTYTASGTYTATFLNAAGCDSSKVLNLTINTGTINPPLTVTACNSYTWAANGNTYTASGSYTHTYLNAAGCLSVNFLSLTINTSAISPSVTATACSSYTWSVTGSTYTTSGNYVNTYLNAAGCLSSDTLHLTINYPSVNTPTNATACNTYTWSANGTTYTASGSYTATFLNAAGCDSSKTLNLTINTSSVNTPVSATACNTYTWSQNGTTYTTSGVYTASYTNAAGCDSSYTLNLTIHQNSVNATQVVAACGSYTWVATGSTYTVSGSYHITLTNVFGCDSVEHLTLTINALPTVTATATPPTTCSYSTVTLTGGGATTYTWSPIATNGVPFTISTTTTYTVTGVDANGCSNTSTVTVTTTGGSTDLVNTTTGNATSVAGTECQTLTQTDASTITYHDVNCKTIVTIQDGTGGNVLGNVTSCAVVSAAVPVYNTQPYIPRYYTINADSPGPAIVTFYLTQDDFNDYNANAGTFPQIPVPSNPANGDITTLCISQVPQTSLPGAPGALTTVIPVTATWNALAARWEITTPVNGFGGFYFHACNPNNVPLPATVTKFTGFKAVTKDVLEWTTSSEQNNAYFNLQHGTDGANFTTLAKVNSKAIGGNSNVNINYSAENLKPSIGHNYYRLMQVDLDGHTSYESQIVDLIWNADGSHVTIYPNPTSDVLNIDLYTSKEVNTVVKVMDMSGRTVKQVLVRTNAGLNTMNISMSEMANGIYTVQILENDKLTYVEKVRKND